MSQLEPIQVVGDEAREASEASDVGGVMRIDVVGSEGPLGRLHASASLTPPAGLIRLCIPLHGIRKQNRGQSR